MMGIPLQSGYIQFVPAGVRATLAYPTPVQTAKDFEKALKSKLFKRLAEEMGETKLLELIREDAIQRGSPVMHVLRSLQPNEEGMEKVSYEYVSGIYEDGMPFNGALASIDVSSEPWDFAAVSTPDKPKTVLQFVKSFQRKTGLQPRIAWNGGYILNPELVGKLGLPETYIGSPLGMLIAGGTMVSPPLFNKPALLIHRNRKLDIQRVNCKKGMVVGWKSWKLQLGSGEYNRDGSEVVNAYYDLMYPHEQIAGNGRIIVRLAGNQVKEIIPTDAKEKVPVIPVGITLALKPEDVPTELKPGDILEISIPGFEEVLHAVEAGPLLLDKGDVSIDMETEGWKTANSIRTQAARLDYTGMRGPKIAVGINREGRLAVLTINGRIRESVGATHADMATILKSHHMEKAMGFDPGGSSTLVVDHVTLNISPYNKGYESDVYAMAPEPRAVSNAVIGFLKAHDL